MYIAPNNSIVSKFLGHVRRYGGANNNGDLFLKQCEMEMFDLNEGVQGELYIN